MNLILNLIPQWVQKNQIKLTKATIKGNVNFCLTVGCHAPIKIDCFIAADIKICIILNGCLVAGDAIRRDVQKYQAVEIVLWNPA